MVVGIDTQGAALAATGGECSAGENLLRPMYKQKFERKKLEKVADMRWLARP